MNIVRHFARNRALYVFLPLLVLLALGAIAGVNWLTGRAVAEDIGPVIGFMLNGIGVATAIVLTDLTQTYLVGFRSERAEGPASLVDDIFDLCATLSLLTLFCIFLWH